MLHDQSMFPVGAEIVSVTHYVQSSAGTRPKDARRCHFRRRSCLEPEADIAQLVLIERCSKVYFLVAIAALGLVLTCERIKKSLKDKVRTSVLREECVKQCIKTL